MSTVISALLAASLVAPIAQAASWEAIPGAPVASRLDDLHFVSPDIGWVVASSGRIYRTTDAGASWDLQFDDISLYFRTIGFANPDRGWAGALSSSRGLYQTSNGGDFWTLVASIPEPKPIGICGLDVVDRSTMFGVGAFPGPARVVTTLDGGVTWTSQDLAPLASTLVDVAFTDAEHGFVVGSVGDFPSTSRAVVLETTDGGATWITRHVGTREGEWCWKISFPNPSVGYISLERFEGPMFFLKTIDGGATWTEMPFANYNEQGIGFVTSRMGWLGGVNNPTFMTTDGGESWLQSSFGSNLNRFQFFGYTLGYASGATVYRYTSEPLDASDPAAGVAAPALALPNPFTPRTSIRYMLEDASPVRLFITDPAGRLVRTLTDHAEPAGIHVVEWDGRDDRGHEVPAGVYLYVLEAGDQHQMGKLVRIA